LCLIDNLKQQRSIVLNFVRPQLRLKGIGGVTTNLIERLSRLPQSDGSAGWQLWVKGGFFSLFRVEDAKSQRLRTLSLADETYLHTRACFAI
jgi:hypothetical protein